MVNTSTRCRKAAFRRAAGHAPGEIKLFCLTLRWSGARISEVLALTPASIDLESGVVSIQTLKRRKRGIVRQVPLPSDLILELVRVFELRIAARHEARYAEALEVEPRDGMEAREVSHESRWYYRHCRPERFASRLWRERI